MEIYTLQWLPGGLGHGVIVKQYWRVWKVCLSGSHLRTEERYVASGGLKAGK